MADPNQCPVSASNMEDEQREGVIGLTAAGRLSVVYWTMRGERFRVSDCIRRGRAGGPALLEATMKDKQRLPIHSRSEIPHFANDDEFAEFWDTHELTEEYLQEASIPREKGPAARLAALAGHQTHPSK